MGSTIVDIKDSFLQSQIRALNQELRPSQNWQGNSSDEHRELRTKAVDDALRALNSKLKEHNLLVYNAPSRRHIAEQIERLYWDAGERGVNIAEAEWKERGADYCLDKSIQGLPESWDDEVQLQRAPEKAKRYQELQSRLIELGLRRKQALEKVERYKALKELLKPFEEPKNTIQPNLVTKDGELGKELDKMRILMARVSGRIQGLGDISGAREDEMDLDGPDEEQKLQGILDMMK